jgi:hypothetical protein
VAAELYIRQARIDRDPERLREIFLQIGRIYLRKLPDAKLATGAFERVLRLEARTARRWRRCPSCTPSRARSAKRCR